MLQRGGYALVVTGLAAVVTNLDISVANAALPTIARHLHTTASESIWIINAFQFAAVIAIVPAAAYAKIVGETALFRAGLALSLLSAIAAAAASSLALFVLCRALQGFATACIWASYDAITRRSVCPEHFGRSMGWISTSTSSGLLFGPIFAGLLIAAASWHCVFLVPVPFVIVALLLSTFVLPAMPGQRGPFDWTGAGLCVLTFGAVVAVLETVGHKESYAFPICFSIVAAVAGAVFIRLQIASPAKCFAVDLFLLPVFSLSIASFVGEMLAFISLPFLFQHIFGFSLLTSGLLIAPWLAGSVLLSPFSGRLADKFNSSVLGAAGLTLSALGLALLIVAPAHSSAFQLAMCTALCGVGFSFFQAPNNRTIIDSTPRDRTSAASGIRGTARLLGQTCGASIAALVFAGGAADVQFISRSAVATNLCVASAVLLGGACLSAARIRIAKQPARTTVMDFLPAK